MKIVNSDIAICLTLAMTLLLWQGALVQFFVTLALRLQRRSSTLRRYQSQMAALILLPVSFVVTFVCLYQWDNSATHWKWQALNLLAQYIMAIYLAGIVVMGSRIAFAIVCGQHLRRVAHPVTDPKTMQVIRDAAKDLGFRNVPPVANCRQVSVPMVLGALKPVILLPAYLTEKTTHDQFRAIITHELVHIRHRDHLVVLVQRLIEAFLFFHPVVWNISWLASAEREHACDDAVVASGNKPHTYMNSLLLVGELQTLSADSRVINCALTRVPTGCSYEVLHRITRLIRNQSKSPR